MIHELPQVTDLKQYLYQYFIVVEQGSKKSSAISFETALNI